MKPRLVTAVVLAGAVVNGEVIAREDRDLPHTHEESHSPEGPTVNTLSFAVNGGVTFSVETETVHFTARCKRCGMSRSSSRATIS